MEEAKQREEDRENNVRRYKKQEEQEKQREQKLERHTGFIQWVHTLAFFSFSGLLPPLSTLIHFFLLFSCSNMKLESAASSSLEDRVKRNIHSIQRTPASLDNFMKRWGFYFEMHSLKCGYLSLSPCYSRVQFKFFFFCYKSPVTK